MNLLDKKSINTIRVLSAEMITKAKSGHPGICLGAAPIMHTLFTRHLNVDVENTKWFNRDRFVLSAGHGSALLYTVMHLAGYNVSMDDLKNFRQKGSLTPGHPEYRHTEGVEMTTGPLGQGFATAVGMAIANKHLSTKYNRSDISLIDYNTYVLCGDGDLQEGVVYEAASLAGRLKLDNLIVLYDSNDIQLDGPTDLAMSDDTKTKFEALGWDYLLVKDGNDVEEIDSAIKEAKNKNKPVIIEVKTVIGYGAENSGEASVHGKPLSQDGVDFLRNALDYHEEAFTVPNDVYTFYKTNVKERGLASAAKFNKDLQKYSQSYPTEAAELMNIIDNEVKLSPNFKLTNYEVGTKVSTRKVMGNSLFELQRELYNMIGGSADLASSTMVKGNDGNFDIESYRGRNINFGVREHAMGAVVNGLTLSNMRGFGSGFFVFSDYLKPAIRLAALMGIPSLFLFSHDTVCVGEDGPTHQPIEQLVGLRSIPNLNVVRPADAKEMNSALLDAVKDNLYPTVITGSRQDLPVLAETNEDGARKGAYLVYEATKSADITIIATGSEVSLAIEAAKRLKDEKVNVKVVSMPSMFIFEQQSEAYKKSVLGKDRNKRLVIEMGSSMSWYKYTDNILGIDTFGASMPIKEIYGTYGYTVENVVDIVKKISK